MQISDILNQSAVVLCKILKYVSPVPATSSGFKLAAPGSGFGSGYGLASVLTGFCHTSLNWFSAATFWPYLTAVFAYQQPATSFSCGVRQSFLVFPLSRRMLRERLGQGIVLCPIYVQSI